MRINCPVRIDPVGGVRVFDGEGVDRAIGEAVLATFFTILQSRPQLYRSQMRRVSARRSNARFNRRGNVRRAMTIGSARRAARFLTSKQACNTRLRRRRPDRRRVRSMTTNLVPSPDVTVYEPVRTPIT
jgi:hypothetical protein